MKKLLLALLALSFVAPAAVAVAAEKDAKAVNACLLIDTQTGKCRQWVVLDAGGGSE